MVWDLWPCRRMGPVRQPCRVLVDDSLEILTEQQCRQLLAQAHVGRVAVTIGALPAIFPVNYALMDGAIVFMTGEGTKLRAALSNTVVAFEVDAIDPLAHGGWSVMAVGIASEITGPDLEQARTLPLRPWAPGERGHYVRIAPELISGRRIQHGQLGD